MSKHRNPRTTKQWEAVNGIDYHKKLSAEERKWLQDFEDEHWANRPRDEALDVASPLNEISVHWSAVKMPLTKDAYSNITPEDIKMFFMKQDEKLSERSLAAKLNMPRTTIQYRLRLVEKMLKELEFADLVPFLEEGMSEEDVKRRLDQLNR